MPSNAAFHPLRRSTRVPLKVVIAIGGGAETRTCDGETIVVNLQGALIATTVGLSTGMRISVHVYLTDNRAAARVVYVDPENPLLCGIELDEPRNIWGVPLPPNDWEEKMSSETGTEAKEAPSGMTQAKEARCPYCIVNDQFPLMAILSNGRLI